MLASLGAKRVMPSREVWGEVCLNGLQTLILFKTEIVYFAML